MKHHYFSVLSSEDEVYNVKFPDLPGAITFGINLEDAVEMAKDALAGHLLVMEDDNNIMPVPTEYEDLVNHLKSNEQLKLISVDTFVSEELNI